MSDELADTGVVGRDVCPSCDADVDLVGREVVTVRWCQTHAPPTEGDADNRVPGVAPCLSGSGEAEGKDCRAVQAMIR